MNDGKQREASPSVSQKSVSDDDEIDYSIKPEFYDSDLDDKDESWVRKKRGGRTSDAILSCPACFTTLCLDCQRHEKNVTQYRAIFVVNCKINDEVMTQLGSKRKWGKRKGEAEAASDNSGTFKHVCCAVCLTKVGVIDEEEVYHFLNVLPSEC
ncbi:E2F-associated phosphoprotein [Ipomoea triloba]|uniref:E2F-associated phosphoprotein n=1 Tax=Ipomoea triloba TaxID=35885 RepID=UPI00125D9939|nr:E2F-associated phosphoprotein [Ipomoea triloba]GLL36296.1 E2F-associated phosphoprotein [Ipomoea trifida]GMD41599.1 E2F-associated phosphoprotein [Ipomoea batatas]